jgi:hypothetical protein
MRHFIKDDFALYPGWREYLQVMDMFLSSNNSPENQGFQVNQMHREDFLNLPVRSCRDRPSSGPQSVYSRSTAHAAGFCSTQKESTRSAQAYIDASNVGIEMYRCFSATASTVIAPAFGGDIGTAAMNICNRSAPPVIAG